MTVPKKQYFINEMNYSLRYLIWLRKYIFVCHVSLLYRSYRAVEIKFEIELFQQELTINGITYTPPYLL